MQMPSENNNESGQIIPANLSCWVITEGLKGTENQCLGVCDALGITPIVKRIKLNQPWKALAPGFRILKSLAISAEGDDIKPPYPDLVIASGRQAVIPAIYIRRASQGKTFVVFLQDPCVDAKYFDLVAVPFHDALRGSNVLITEGAPNRVTMKNYIQTKTYYDEVFSKLPSPLVSVFIGGNSKRHSITEKHASEILRKLKHLQRDYGAGLMISVSRRTPLTIRNYLRQECHEMKNCYFWGGQDEDGENPYDSMFKFADFFLITEDSISMLSEAASTGKPVYRLPMPGKAGKFTSFYTYMEQRDAIKPFKGVLDNFNYRPLKDAEMIATVIRSEVSTNATEGVE